MDMRKMWMAWQWQIWFLTMNLDFWPFLPGMGAEDMNGVLPSPGRTPIAMNLSFLFMNTGLCNTD